MTRSSDPLTYAGFWPRFCAMFLDLFFFIPLIAFVMWGKNTFRTFDLYFLLPGLLFQAFYSVYLVQRYGGTPGKRIMNLRIKTVEGGPIGYHEAWLRFLPDFIFGILMNLALISASLRMTDAEYGALTFANRFNSVELLAPLWLKPLRFLQRVWIWSEFIVLLTNRKRRALHDFIAGTVVVIEEPTKKK